MIAYPIDLNLAGRDVLVVGGGHVAARKVAGLVAAGAVVRVVSLDFVPELLQRSDIQRQVAAYTADMIGAARLLFACTDDPDTNARVAADARAGGRWCNVADEPDAGDFLVPAVLRQGELTVAVGTGGAGPQLAALLRDRLQSQFGPELGILVAELKQARRIVRERVPDRAVRREILATLCAECSIKLIASRGRDAWRDWFERVLRHRLETGPRDTET